MRFKGAAIRQLRESRSWTTRELARRIAATGHFSGFTHQRVEQLERSDNVSHRVICALCEVFHIQPAELFEEEKD
ncbi:MAG: helix-turn-helix transcriptional regulator [Leptospirales bacterium]|nr:helix-turn-helix transcriptional regulator [Leptospirales bacterium]